MKKLLSLIVAVLLCVTAFAGCGQGSGGDEFSNRPYKVVVTYSANAYGKAWITELAKDYMTNYNEDTYIQLKQTVVPTEEKSKIQSGTATSDLYFMDVHYEDLSKSVMTNISDVYNSTALGETVLVKDKVNKAMYKSATAEGIADYVMPYQEVGMGYGMAYNKNVLDRAYPSGYTLPRTTAEFAEMGATLAGQDKYLLVCSFSDNTDWIDYSTSFWFAQLLGSQGYEKFSSGLYYDENVAGEDKWVLNESEPVIFTKNEQAIKDWYQILIDIAQPSNQYIHKDSNSIDFMSSEAVMAGYGFGQNGRDTAFICHAAFLESEMSWMLEDQKAANNEQTLGMMKIPLASQIIRRTPSITTDAVLREVVSYVDGDTTTKPAGVTDTDIEIVREARGMAINYMGGGAVIPSSASNKDGAKEFLRYLASDKASIIASQNTYGIPFLPYGKVATDEEMGITRTAFMNDCVKHMSTTTSLVSVSYPFSVHTDHSFHKPNDGKVKSVFSGDGRTAQDFYNETYSYFATASAGGQSRWVTNVRDYKIAMGIN